MYKRARLAWVIAAGGIIFERYGGTKFLAILKRFAEQAEGGTAAIVTPPVWHERIAKNTG